MIAADFDQGWAGRPLLRTSSSLSANGTTSSARECRIVVFCLTFLAGAVFLPGRAEKTSGVSPLSSSWRRPPRARSDDDLRAGASSYSAWAIAPRPPRSPRRAASG